METILGFNDDGLFVQYTGKITKKVVKRKIKEKVYSSTQYHISVPLPLVNFIDSDVIFMNQISKTKYSLSLNEEEESIRLTFRKSKSQSKKYAHYLLTLPKKFFSFLDYEFVEGMVMNILVYVKDGNIHIDLSL